MFRRYPGLFGASSCVPSNFRDCSAARRNRCHGYSGRSRRRHRVYGPRYSSFLNWRARDRRYWSWMDNSSAVAEEEQQKSRDQEIENNRVPEAEVEKLTVLTVKNVDLCFKENGKRHKTGKYDCTKGEEPQLVVRRGFEFTVTVTFNRPYQKEKDDLIFVLDADEENPAKNLGKKFKLDEYNKGTYTEEQEWGARISQMDSANNSITMEVFIPANCVIGEWDLKVKTRLEGTDDVFVFKYPKSIIILFNPWCKEDQVHFTDDVKYLKEYVLNEDGAVFRGSATFISSSPWEYGQFKPGVLNICLSILRKAFGFKMSPRMADPIAVSRALSKIVNSLGDDGVLVGNWTGDYDDGTRPTVWKSSVNILKQYEDSGKPVKFGQCWVFSHVLTTVCRALGLPCRSITNFDSAHDTDGTCTIDYYYDEEGEELTGMKSDSIWNFHVWNEVWIMRPDLPEDDYNGWHTIDATPQEESDGCYQCGPCPVKAVKKGYINVGYDTAFVFAEVNSDVVHWVVDGDGELLAPSAVKKRSVGSFISTKYPDGQGFRGNVYLNKNDPTLRHDVTWEYKFKEGTEEERDAVKRAVRFGRHGDKLFQGSVDLEVSFGESEATVVGKDLKVTCFVKNVSEEDKNVQLSMSSRTCTYWNRSVSHKSLVKERFEPRVIKPSFQETYMLTIKADDYMKKCDESMSVFVYACAKDLKADMPFTAQMPIALLAPELDVQGPAKAKLKQKIPVSVSFTNFLPMKLTECHVVVQGGLSLSPDDTNNMEEFFWTYSKSLDEIQPGGKLELKFIMDTDVELDDEEEEETRTVMISLQSQEFTSIEGSHTVLLQRS